MLNAMGAQIEGAGTSTIRIKGVAKLHGARHRINPDRIEAGTFLIAGAITGRRPSTSTAANPEHLGSLLSKLEECGVSLEVGKDRYPSQVLAASSPQPTSPPKSIPGFPTDMQAQMMTLLTQAEGTSIVTENIFENRFMHVSELNRMGANISVSGPHRHDQRRRETPVRRPSCAPIFAPPPLSCSQPW